MSKLQEYLAARAQCEAIVANHGEEVVKEAFASFFQDFPAVHGVRWTQYAPSFNDGDPCVFSVHEPNLQWEAEGDYEDSYSIADQAKAYDAADNLVNNIEDLLESVFGNGKEVTVSKDLAITHDWCDCD